MCDLACSDKFPHFVTTEQENGIWECKLSIPGVKTTAIAHGKTEAESINRCAINMIFILKRDHDKDQFDPDLEVSIFAGNMNNSSVTLTMILNINIIYLRVTYLLNLMTFRLLILLKIKWKIRLESYMNVAKKLIKCHR